MPEHLPTFLAAAGWLLAELRLFLHQRAAHRERTDLLNRVQAGTFAEYRHARLEARRTPAPLEPTRPEAEPDEPVVSPTDLVAARTAFRNLSAGEVRG